MLIFEKILRHNIHVCVIELNEIADICDWTIQNCWYSTALELVNGNLLSFNVTHIYYVLWAWKKSGMIYILGHYTGYLGEVRDKEKRGKWTSLCIFVLFYLRFAN